MRAMCLAGSAGKLALIEKDMPQPQPGRGELLIRIIAAGITPAELTWYPTTHLQTGEERIGAVPAHEFSGIVAAVGEEVADAEIGPPSLRHERLVRGRGTSGI